MSSAGKRIFGDHDPVSAHDMERYLSGAMDPEEMSAFEQRLVDDDLSQDAMEGFEGNEAMLAEVGLMAATFKTSIGAGSKGGFLASSGGKMLMTGLAVAGTTAIITVAVMNQDDPVVEEPELIAENIEAVEEEEMEDTSEEALLAAEPIEEEEQITFEDAYQHQPIAIPQTVPEEQVEEYVKKVVLELEELEEIDPITIEVQPLPDEPIRVSRSNYAVTIINHLLVIDYSRIYGDIEENSLQHDQSIHDGHLDSPFETFDQRDGHEPQIVTTYTPYLDFLELALAKFEEGEFSDALKDLEYIRKQYPSDMNVHFYGGLCYYNLNKKNKAIEYFQAVQLDPANTFDQDAQYYEALTWIKKGNDKKALAVLDAIIELDDFYSGQAMELKAEIEND